MSLSPVEIFRGDTWVRSWIIKYNQIPLDFTNASARLYVKKTFNDETPSLSASTVTGELSFGEAGDGKILLQVQTASLDAGRYFFDLEVTFENGVVQTYEQNSLIVKADVTR